MTTKWITFLRPNFITIFQEIHQTLQVSRFFQREKRFKKWWKLRVLSCAEDHSYTEIKLPNGCTKSCKMTPKCITNQREMTMKKHRFQSYNGKKRTPSTELRNCMKTRSFLSFPVLLCSSSACRNRTKSSKNKYKLHRKKMCFLVSNCRNLISYIDLPNWHSGSFSATSR